MEEVKEISIEQPQEVVQQEEAKTETPAAEETQEQINWRKFRQVREQERKEKIAAERKAAEKEAEAAALKAAMDALLNKNQPSNQTQAQNAWGEEEETEDQRIQKKIDAALMARERQYEEERRRKEQQEYPQKLAETYRDFNEVCSSENLDYLEYHYPELAKPFKYMPDGFDKWSSVYQAVKRFVPNTNTKGDHDKMHKNAIKPQSISVPAGRQTGDGAPSYLDDKRKADNWARMLRIMKG